MSAEPGSPPSANAVFLVRAWREGDVFRARITYLFDITRGPPGETKVYVTDTAGVHRHLDVWLHELRPEPDDTRPGQPD